MNPLHLHWAERMVGKKWGTNAPIFRQETQTEICEECLNENVQTTPKKFRPYSYKDREGVVKEVHEPPTPHWVDFTPLHGLQGGSDRQQHFERAKEILGSHGYNAMDEDHLAPVKSSGPLAGTRGKGRAVYGKIDGVQMEDTPYLKQPAQIRAKGSNSQSAWNAHDKEMAELATDMFEKHLGATETLKKLKSASRQEKGTQQWKDAHAEATGHVQRWKQLTKEANDLHPGELLSISPKSEGTEAVDTHYKNWIHYMPSKESGRVEHLDACTCASGACTDACLSQAGKGGMAPVLQARYRREHMRRIAGAHYWAKMINEVHSNAQKSEKEGKTAYIRLNGTTDHPNHAIAKKFFGLFDGSKAGLPKVQFGEYTKVMGNLNTSTDPAKQIPNLHVTFSSTGVSKDPMKESNWHEVRRHLTSGGDRPVSAMVFKTKNPEELPHIVYDEETGHVFPVEKKATDTDARADDHKRFGANANQGLIAGLVFKAAAAPAGNWQKKVTDAVNQGFVLDMDAHAPKQEHIQDIMKKHGDESGNFTMPGRYKGMPISGMKVAVVPKGVPNKQQQSQAKAATKQAKSQGVSRVALGLPSGQQVEFNEGINRLINKAVNRLWEHFER